jgi:transposase
VVEPARRTVLRRYGDDDARRAVHANRVSLLSGVARIALVLRAVLCAQAFGHVLDRGGMRRTRLRGRDNVARRYLIQVAGQNLGLLVRSLFGAGTPRAAADLRLLWLAVGDLLLLVRIARRRTDTNTGPAAIAIITVTPDNDALVSNGC